MCPLLLVIRKKEKSLISTTSVVASMTGECFIFSCCVRLKFRHSLSSIVYFKIHEHIYNKNLKSTNIFCIELASLSWVQDKSNCRYVSPKKVKTVNTGHESTRRHSAREDSFLSFPVYALQSLNRQLMK